MTYDFTKHKEDALSKPRNKAWTNFFKFEKIGDSVQGFIRDVFYRPAEGIYKEQRGITLEQEDGVFVNVTIKRLDFILKETDNLRLGDPLTITFEKEIVNKDTSKHNTKQLGFYGKNLPENEGEKTVRELDLEDQGLAAEEAKATAVEDAKVNEEFKPEGTETAAPAAPTAPTAATGGIKKEDTSEDISEEEAAAAIEDKPEAPAAPEAK